MRIHKMREFASEFIILICNLSRNLLASNMIYFINRLVYTQK
jgi:hypothetical protein